MDTRERSTSGSLIVCDSHVNDLNSTLGAHELTEFMGPRMTTSHLGNSMPEKVVDSCNEVNVSNELYDQKCQDCSINQENTSICHHFNPEGIFSEEIHFPMRLINQKMKNMINRKKGCAFNRVASRFAQSHLPLRKHTVGSYLTEFAAKEPSLGAQDMPQSSDKEFDPCEASKTFQLFQDEFTASISQSAAEKFESPTTNLSTVYSKDKKVSTRSDHVFEHPIQASLTNVNRMHNLHNFVGQSRFTGSGAKAGSKVASNIRSSWSRKKSEYINAIEDSWPGNLPFPSKDRINEIEYVNHSLSNMPDCFFHNVGNSDMHENPNSANSYGNPNSGTHTNGGSADPYNSLDFWLMRKMDTELSQGKNTMVNSTETAQVNYTNLFEMFTLPAISMRPGKQEGDLPFINLSSMRNGDDGFENETYMMETRKISYSKIDAVQVDACPVTSSPTPVGMIFDRLQKDLERTKLINHHVSAIPIKQAMVRHAASLDRRCSTSNEELNVSKTGSKDVVQAVTHAQRSIEYNSVCVIENSTMPEHSSKWLKRLRPRTSDMFSAKRTNIGVDPTSADVYSLSSDLGSYKIPSPDMNKNPKEQPISLGTNNSSSALECSNEPSVKENQYWIKRWCCDSCQKVESYKNISTPGLCEPEIPQSSLDNFEGKQFPSIRAMALMGRAMNSSQTPKFKRKGSTVLWNDDDF
ncbi:hypothetical protein ZIOFF_011097 [Zingiber officinale]|uniref:Uncharacterized protein n=1 Tax=Zingiber officinale TaxID=94328 RepID=A0A8J5LPT0_ZINOF|nr:hypothetical protein ZIOFF_011097 [Zingiber officinale]